MLRDCEYNALTPGGRDVDDDDGAYLSRCRGAGHGGPPVRLRAAITRIDPCRSLLPVLATLDVSWFASV